MGLFRLANMHTVSNKLMYYKHICDVNLEKYYISLLKIQQIKLLFLYKNMITTQTRDNQVILIIM